MAMLQAGGVSSGHLFGARLGLDTASSAAIGRGGRVGADTSMLGDLAQPRGSE